MAISKLLLGGDCTFGSPGLAFSRYWHSSSICRGDICQHSVESTAMRAQRLVFATHRVKSTMRCSEARVLICKSLTSFWPTKFCEDCAMMMPLRLSMICFSFACTCIKQRKCIQSR